MRIVWNYVVCSSYFLIFNARTWNPGKPLSNVIMTWVPVLNLKLINYWGTWCHSIATWTYFLSILYIFIFWILSSWILSQFSLCCSTTKQTSLNFSPETNGKLWLLFIFPFFFFPYNLCIKQPTLNDKAINGCLSFCLKSIFVLNIHE